MLVRMTDRIAPDYWHSRAEVVRTSLPKLMGAERERAVLLLGAYEEISRLVGERAVDHFSRVKAVRSSRRPPGLPGNSHLVRSDLVRHGG